MDRALIDGSAAAADRRSEERTMSRLTLAYAQPRIRALISLAILMAIALVTEAGHRW